MFKKTKLKRGVLLRNSSQNVIWKDKKCILQVFNEEKRQYTLSLKEKLQEEKDPVKIAVILTYLDQSKSIIVATNEGFMVTKAH